VTGAGCLAGVSVDLSPPNMEWYWFSLYGHNIPCRLKIAVDASAYLVWRSVVPATTSGRGCRRGCPWHGCAESPLPQPPQRVCCTSPGSRRTAMSSSLVRAPILSPLRPLDVVQVGDVLILTTVSGYSGRILSFNIPSRSVRRQSVSSTLPEA